MNNRLTKITLPGENGEADIELYVLEQTRIAGKDYLLVCDTEDGDGNAYVLEDCSGDGDTEAAYIFVEDDARLDALSGVFSHMLDDDITLVQ